MPELHAGIARKLRRRARKAVGYKKIRAPVRKESSARFYIGERRLSPPVRSIRACINRPRVLWEANNRRVEPHPPTASLPRFCRRGQPPTRALCARELRDIAASVQRERERERERENACGWEVSRGCVLLAQINNTCASTCTRSSAHVYKPGAGDRRVRPTSSSTLSPTHSLVLLSRLR